MKKVEIRAAGGVLYRLKSGDPIVLMIKRNGVWDLPKGKFEEGESVEECAIREVSEETGADGLQIGGYLTETYHEYKEGEAEVGKVTDWYAMMEKNGGRDTFTPQEEEGITELKWVPLYDAEKMVGYKNLQIVLERFREFIQGR
ncbi:MAG: NUDIX domain-containing protein [Balneolaceae bacterium]|nr:NUDIX domain-containing protein [Balneolaceae bacterium]MCH8547592.1 NUDIX domain-containing protein [Balneolaceae bacterium]